MSRGGGRIAGLAPRKFCQKYAAAPSPTAARIMAMMTTGFFIYTV